jgi:hypothetical protein
MMVAEALEMFFSLDSIVKWMIKLFCGVHSANKARMLYAFEQLTLILSVTTEVGSREPIGTFSVFG